MFFATSKQKQKLNVLSWFSTRQGQYWQITYEKFKSHKIAQKKDLEILFLLEKVIAKLR